MSWIHPCWVFLIVSHTTSHSCPKSDQYIQFAIITIKCNFVLSMNLFLESKNEHSKRKSICKCIAAVDYASYHKQDEWLWIHESNSLWIPTSFDTIFHTSFLWFMSLFRRGKLLTVAINIILHTLTCCIWQLLKLYAALADCLFV